jgi:hypothetical protein
MQSLKKSLSLGFLAVIAVTSGCMTWEANIDDMSSVYMQPAKPGAATIIISDLSDNRTNQELVGRICALNLATKKPINVIIANRIASRLKQEGFNVQKAALVNPRNKREAVEALKRTDGKVIITGNLDHFFIESSDAILETAKGRVTFRIDILDKFGKSVFYKMYSAYTEKHIGLGGGKGSEEFIEKTVQETVNQLFYDTKFRAFLSQMKK